MHYHLADHPHQTTTAYRLPNQKLLGLACLAVFLFLMGKIWVPYAGAVVNAGAITFLPPSWTESYFAATLPKAAATDTTNHIDIDTPTLHIHAPIIEGDTPDDLLKGVGHAASSAVPGDQGRVVLSGHRFYPNASPYATVFFQLDKLKVGDSININYSGQKYVYHVTESWEVPKDEATLHLAPTTQRLLTIYTCNPTYSSKRRMGFTAVMDESSIKHDSQKVIQTLQDGILQ